MPLLNETKLSPPSWYMTERDTQKTINKLTTTKELSFYLSNPDEFIRRLAIIRIQELYLKDALDTLKMLLDDSLETSQNKELAAWAIKSICFKWNIDIFYTSRYLSKYTGSEKYNDIFKLTIKDSLPSIKYNFSSALIKTDIDLDKIDLRKSEDIEFDMPFSIKEWFSAWCDQFLLALKKVFINLPHILFKALIIVAKYIFIVFPKFVYKMVIKIKNNIKNRQEKKSSKSLRSPHSYESYYKSMKPSFSIKAAIFKLLYVIFTPVRFLVKRRKLIAVFIIALYCFFTYTSSGRVYTLKKFNVDLMQYQNYAISTAKDIGTIAYYEFKNILEID